MRKKQKLRPVYRKGRKVIITVGTKKYAKYLAKHLPKEHPKTKGKVKIK